MRNLKSFLLTVSLLFSFVCAAQRGDKVEYNQVNAVIDGIEYGWHEEQATITYKIQTVDVVTQTSDTFTLKQVGATIRNEERGDYYRAALYNMVNGVEVIVQRFEDITFARIIFDDQNYLELKYEIKEEL